MPQETRIDFSTERLPDAPRLSTVGLWCGLHGDSFLQAACIIWRHDSIFRCFAINWRRKELPR